MKRNNSGPIEIEKYVSLNQTSTLLYSENRIGDRYGESVLIILWPWMSGRKVRTSLSCLSPPSQTAPGVFWRQTRHRSGGKQTRHNDYVLIEWIDIKPNGLRDAVVLCLNVSDCWVGDDKVRCPSPINVFCLLLLRYDRSLLVAYACCTWTFYSTPIAWMSQCQKRANQKSPTNWHRFVH